MKETKMPKNKKERSKYFRGESQKKLTEVFEVEETNKVQ